jgi:hypothetical protein
MPVATAASVERPSPSHLALSPRWSLWHALRARRAVRTSGDPIAPEKDIKIVSQLPEKDE